MEDKVKNLKQNNIHCFLHMHQDSHLVEDFHAS